MLGSVLILIVSFAVLMGGAELLVRGAAALARRLGMSSFFIGLTIVGFGTSTPELVTSVAAAMDGLDDIALGNIVGSNIFNVAVILGIAALITPIAVNTQVVRRELNTMILVAFVPFAALLTGNTITRAMGLLMVAGLAVFLYTNYRSSKPQAASEAAIEKELEAELGLKPGSVWGRVWVSLLAVGAGLVALVIGSRLLIAGAVDIAQTLGISELAIGLTIVAAGTSMPELFTSVVAALRKEMDISVGNIVGSNIFNILGIGGVTATLYPQFVRPQLFWLDLPVMVCLCAACLPVMITGQRISRLEGAVFFLVYLVYMVVLFRFAPEWFGGAESVGTENP